MIYSERDSKLLSGANGGLPELPVCLPGLWRSSSLWKDAQMPPGLMVVDWGQSGTFSRSQQEDLLKICCLDASSGHKKMSRTASVLPGASIDCVPQVGLPGYHGCMTDHLTGPWGYCIYRVPRTSHPGCIMAPQLGRVLRWCSVAGACVVEVTMWTRLHLLGSTVVYCPHDFPNYAPDLFDFSKSKYFQCLWRKWKLLQAPFLPFSHWAKYVLAQDWARETG